MPPSRRGQIIDAATRLFYREGFHGTGIERVIQEAGVSRMTLYYHFKSKDELIEATLEHRHEHIRDRMATAIERAGDDPRARIEAIFDEHAAWFAEDEFHGCMFVNACAEFTNPECTKRSVAVAHKRDMLALLDAPCRDLGVADPTELAENLMLLLEGATVSAELHGRTDCSDCDPVDAARRAQRIAGILLEQATIAA